MLCGQQGEEGLEALPADSLKRVRETYRAFKMAAVAAAEEAQSTLAAATQQAAAVAAAGGHVGGAGAAAPAALGLVRGRAWRVTGQAEPPYPAADVPDHMPLSGSPKCSCGGLILPCCWLVTCPQS
jgi:hypothetical protein